MIRTQLLGSNFFLLLVLFFSSTVIHGQTDSIQSTAMNQSRLFQVDLPENYSPQKKYACIYVLDGFLIGSVVNGISQYYAKVDKSAETIVIRINQENTRWKDCSYITANGNLGESGNKFFHFISDELIPYIDSLYATSGFRTIVGHSFTANYVNYFFLDDSNLFNAFIAVSPYYAKGIVEKIKTKANSLTTYRFYYLSYAENDLTGHIRSVKNANKILSTVENENFVFKCDKIPNKKHLSLIPQSIDNGVLWTNKYYRLIYNSFNKKEMKKRKGELMDYFISYYDRIESVYKYKMDYRFEDVDFMSLMISRYGEIEELKTFGEFSIKEFPNAYAGYFSLGEYYEKRKQYKKAIDYYQQGYDRLGDDCANKDTFYEPIEKLKKKQNN